MDKIWKSENIQCKPIAEPININHGEVQNNGIFYLTIILNIMSMGQHSVEYFLFCVILNIFYRAWDIFPNVKKCVSY